MALEVINDVITFQPGPVDVHTHPRIYDPITPDEFEPLNRGQEGKAGLAHYTEVALRSGFVAMLAMPNEARRLFLSSHPERTVLEQFPIATLDRLKGVQSIASEQAVIPTGFIFGLDPNTAVDEQKDKVNVDYLRNEFESVKDECFALKIYGAETTGGNNIARKFIPEIVGLWYEKSPEKPVIMHLENENVAEVLSQIDKLPNGKEIPLHIAHVSSREELEAVIAAKKAGMNVTCEVTPHHLTFNETLPAEIGSYGCMKPTLKRPDDIEFMWENMDYIDMFASDCAPHRISDKEKSTSTNPIYGVTNHTVMLSVLMAAVEDGKITYEDIYQKLCVKPRERFNLPDNDGSLVKVARQPVTAIDLERMAESKYGQNPWLKTTQRTHLFGRVIAAKAGMSSFKVYGSDDVIHQPKRSYSHLLRPEN